MSDPAATADAVAGPPAQPFRVKLYQLDTSGNWGDIGTGFVTLHHVPASSGNGSTTANGGNSNGSSSSNGSGTGSEALVLSVRSDVNEALLVEHRVDVQTEYERQQGSILTWSEGDQEFAISFQDGDACAEVWEQVMQAQSKNEDELIAGSELIEPDLQVWSLAQVLANALDSAS